MIALFRYWRQRAKLRRGRCEFCGKILRDDQRDACSPECEQEVRDRTAW